MIDIYRDPDTPPRVSIDVWHRLHTRPEGAQHQIESRDEGERLIFRLRTALALAFPIPVIVSQKECV